MGKLVLALDSGLLGLPPTPVSISHTGAHGDSHPEGPRSHLDPMSLLQMRREDPQAECGPLNSVEEPGPRFCPATRPSCTPGTGVVTHKAGSVSHQWACTGPPCSSLQPRLARCAVSTALPHRGAEGTGLSCISQLGSEKVRPKVMQGQDGLRHLPKLSLALSTTQLFMVTYTYHPRDSRISSLLLQCERTHMHAHTHTQPSFCEHTPHRNIFPTTPSSVLRQLCFPRGLLKKDKFV